MQEQSIFIEALEKSDPTERAAYLDRVCAGDQAVRDRIERLLERHEQAGSFLEPSVAGGAGVTADVPVSERPGTVIGPFKLLEKIGEGGFGVVFMADQQQPLRRKVALKVLKPGMDTGQVVARFEAERQALALMNHPNIAHVIDGGQTNSGRPYFVMELVKGIPITQYCDAHQLSPRERLALFVPVCEAVQHAHQKGIIHRDLKPSNVLVAAYDGRPVPKVIDFGVAKAMGQQLTERTLVTSFGGIIGTLEYMSPEQAEFNALDIDTRADIYGLGVLLYELLTGTTPLTKQRLKEAAIMEALRLIREEEPPTPSTRLSASQESLASISAQRKLEPARLAKEIRGELDWIVMRCLEKDRTRRYETANGLARDIQRHLNDEPVEAGPPSASYKLRKFARKYRKSLWVAAGFALLLALGTAVSTWQAIRATVAERATAHERDKVLVEKARADEEAAIANAVNEFLQKDLLGQADIGNQAMGMERDKDVKVRDLLDRAAERVEAKFRGYELTEAAIQLTLSNAYGALGEYPTSQKHAERSLELRRRKLGDNHRDTLESLHALAGIFRVRGQFADAERLYLQALDGRRATLGPNHGDTLRTLNGLGVTYSEEGRHDKAERTLHEALEAQRATLGPNHDDTLMTMENLASLYLEMDRPELAEKRLPQVAEELLKNVLAARRAKLGDDHPETLSAMNTLSVLYWQRGRHADAIALSKSVLDTMRSKRGADHPYTLGALQTLGAKYRDAGRYDEAEPLLVEAVAGTKKKLGLSHWLTQEAVQHLSDLHLRQGKPELSEPNLREMVEFHRVHSGIESKAFDDQLGTLFRNLMERKRFAEAEPLARERVEIHIKKAPDEWMTFLVKSFLGLNLLLQKKYAEAEPLLLQGFQGLKEREAKIPKIAAVRLDHVLAWLVRLYDEWGKETEAARWRKELEEEKARRP